jgi:hypothetical protein
MNTIGCTERTLTLRQIPHNCGFSPPKEMWAWQFEDNGAILEYKFFDSEEEAKDYMKERTKDSVVVQTKIK